MSNIKKTYALIKAESIDLNSKLFINYLKQMEKDEHFQRVLLKIIDEMELLESKNGKLFKNKTDVDDDVELKEHTFLIADLLGQYRESKFIKKLTSRENSYELRINYEYEKHRILIFPVDIELDGLIVPFITFSYAFAKSGNGTDETQELLESSQRLRDQLYEGKIDHRSYYAF